MDSVNPKRIKTVNQELAEVAAASEEEEDRISNLPSILISNILSLLPTKYAVATSALSTKWKHHWRSITCLEFSDKQLLNPPDNNNNNNNNKINHPSSLEAKFISFMYRVLLLGKFSYIELFHLDCSPNCDTYHINQWTDSVLKSDVIRKFSLSVMQKNSVLPPKSLYTCSTLVKLKLVGKFLLSVPISVSLPNLKSINIANVKFPDDDSVTRLLSGCPVLESLGMETCMGKDVRVIRVSVPSLTHLLLNFLPYMDDFSDKKEPRFHIVLHTPSLVDLSIRGFITKGYVLGKLPLLENAMIYVRNWDKTRQLPFQDIHHDAINSLAQGICKVKKLYFAIQSIHRSQVPIFKHLTDLTFGLARKAALEVLPDLLEKSPQLRLLTTLNYEDGSGDIDEDDDDIPELVFPANVPHCLLYHLKRIEIRNFRGSTKEVKMVEYLLEKAQVLERFTTRRLDDNPPKVSSEILMNLPRASKICQIVYM